MILIFFIITPSGSGEERPTAPEGVPREYKHKWVTQARLNEDRSKHGGETLFESSWDLYGDNPSEALFFHGTDWKSLLKILDSGMQIVRRESFGEVFGKGLYLSDTTRKASGYARPISKDCQENSDLRDLIRIVGRANAEELCKSGKRPVLILRAKPGKLLKVGVEDKGYVTSGKEKEPTPEQAAMKKKFNEFGREALADFDGVYGVTQFREIIIFSPRRMHIVGVAWLSNEGGEFSPETGEDDEGVGRTERE